MFQIIFGVAGGLAIFLYGMSLCSDGLQKVSGSALKSIIHKLTSNPLIGVLVGAVVTVLIQSSSATTVILVGLVSASLMNLAQAIGVILGADIGTTLTVQLIAFNVTSYSLLFIAIGFGLRFLAKKPRVKYIGQVVMGFGFIFFGMGIMSSTMEPLKNYPGAQELFASFGSNPLLGLLVATVFTAVVQGSAATIGIVLSLAIQGIMPLQSAIPLILGANIGTCATALLAAIGAPTEAKRVSMAHVLFKILGVIIIWPFIGPFTRLVQATSGDVARQIANAHSLFNVGITVVFLPFASKLARLVEFLVPQRAQAVPDIQKPMYLDQRNLDTPVLALEQVRAEIVRVARMIHQMTVNAGHLLKNDDEDLSSKTYELEDGVDRLYREITAFLADIARRNLTTEQSRENIVSLQAINDLEHIGDTIIRMLQIISKKSEKHHSFSEEGQMELQDFFDQIIRLTERLVATLESPESNRVEALMRDAQDIINQERVLRISHIRRLHAQIAVTRDTSPIHMDLTDAMRRIAEHSQLIAINLSSDTDPLLEERYFQAYGEPLPSES